MKFKENSCRLQINKRHLSESKLCYTNYSWTAFSPSSLMWPCQPLYSNYLAGIAPEKAQTKLNIPCTCWRRIAKVTSMDSRNPVVRSVYAKSFSPRFRRLSAVYDYVKNWSFDSWITIKRGLKMKLSRVRNSRVTPTSPASQQQEWQANKNSVHIIFHSKTGPSGSRTRDLPLCCIL